VSLRIKNRQLTAAQATLEYLLLLTVAIAAFIVMALMPDNYFQSVLTNSLNERAMTMDAFTSALDGSDPDVPAIGP